MRLLSLAMKTLKVFAVWCCLSLAATMGDGGMASEDLSLAAGCSMLHFYLVYPHHGTLQAAEEAGMLTAVGIVNLAK